MNAIILSLNNNLIINNDFQSDTHFIVVQLSRQKSKLFIMN